MGSDAHDHCDRDPLECSYEALVGEYREAVAERDRLRAVARYAADVASSSWWPAVTAEFEPCRRLGKALKALRAFDRERAAALDGSGDTGGDEDGT